MHYGMSDTTFEDPIFIPNQGTEKVTYIVPSLSWGKYWFQVKAVDTNDLESIYTPDTAGTGDTFCVDVSDRPSLCIP